MPTLSAFLHLVVEEEIPGNKSATFTRAIRYILVNDLDVTYGKDMGTALTPVVNLYYAYAHLYSKTTWKK